jgi:hypothetical protein
MAIPWQNAAKNATQQFCFDPDKRIFPSLSLLDGSAWGCPVRIFAASYRTAAFDLRALALNANLFPAIDPVGVSLFGAAALGAKLQSVHSSTRSVADLRLDVYVFAYRLAVLVT